MTSTEITERGSSPRLVESSPGPTRDERAALVKSLQPNNDGQTPAAIVPEADQLATASGTIQFVCTANVTRSVFMHLTLRKLLEEAGLGGIEIRSAGLKATVGAGPHPEVGAWLERQHVPFEGFVARQLTPHNVASADLVITATRRQRDQVVRMTPLSSTKTFTVLQLHRLLEGDPDPVGHGPQAGFAPPAHIARLAASRRGLTSSLGAADDVSDPTGKRSAAFASMFELVHPVLRSLVKHLKAAHPTLVKEA